MSAWMAQPLSRAADIRSRLSRPVAASSLLLALLSLVAIAGLLGPGSAGGRCCASPPAATHLLGTATDGSDLVLAVARGLGTSAAICIAATLLALVLGVAWGATAAVLPARAERAMLRVVHALDVAPWTVFVISFAVIVRAARPSLPSALEPVVDGRFVMILAVASIEWLTLARVVHARIASLQRRPFIDLARSLGMPRWRILVVHVVPHTAGPLIAYGVLALPGALAAEAFLSFLGVGVEAPHVSLGTLVAGGAGAMSVAPLVLLLPASALVAATVALHVVGAHLRDGLRPERRRTSERW